MQWKSVVTKIITNIEDEQMMTDFLHFWVNYSFKWQNVRLQIWDFWTASFNPGKRDFCALFGIYRK